MLISNVEIHRVFSSFLFGHHCRYPRYLRPGSNRSTLQKTLFSLLGLGLSLVFYNRE